MSSSVRADSYPLSPIQQGMLFNSLYAGQSGVDVEQIACRLNEPLDVPLFEKSWHLLICRHPVLRTAFRWEGLPEPVQDVYDSVRVPLNQTDWSSSSKVEQEEMLTKFLFEDRQQGFSLSEIPLMRHTLFYCGANQFIFIWTFHHILLDGRSFTLLLQELFEVYESLVKGEDIQLDSPRPFRDHIDFLQKMDLGEMESYWRKKLEHFTEPVSLPDLWEERFDREGGEQHKESITRLSQESTERLEQLAKKNNLTINTFVQGAWALLLSRYSRMQDIVFGATRACRYSTVSEADAMIGCLINTVPVRIYIDPEKQLIPWLTELRELWVEMRPYEQAPLASVQQWSDIPKGMQLFESILVFEKYLMNTSLRRQGGSWHNREFQVHEQTNFPLTVAAYLDDGLVVKIEYEQGFFDEKAVDRMAGHVIELLESMILFPERPIGHLRMSTRAEREKLLFFWNNNDAPPPPDACYHALFEEQAARTPDAPAVEFMGDVLSYGELNHRANQLANYLVKLGVAPDTLVGICMDRSLEMAVGLIGIFKAAGAYLPLDPAYPQDRLEYMLEDSGAEVVLVQEHLRDTIPSSIEHVISLDNQWQHVEAESGDNLQSPAKPDNLAYLIYTSGTTGKPKGVMIPHRQLISHNLAIVRLFELQPQDRALQFASISFDIAVEEFFPTWLAGACLVLRTEEMASNISRFVEGCEAAGITILNLPTAFWHELVRGLAETGAELAESVRLTIVGGEKASAPAYQKWKEMVSANVRWLNTYGPTETTVSATTFDPANSSWLGKRHKEIPIGRPLDNTLVYILDPNGHSVPVGIPGELHISGFGVGRGYLNRDDLTKEKFIPDPFNGDNDQKMYKTGDLVRYLENGDIEFLGRTDHQVKIRGFRIELGEIETVVTEYGGVHETVVLAREDNPGEKKLVAYLLPTHGTTIDISDLQGFLTKRLPAYMVPTAFVVMESFPMTPGGKINRHQLPVPEYNDSGERTGQIVEPKLPVEVTLVEMWEELLGVSPIGITDNFFEMGGDSLLAVRLFTQIEQEFDRTLPLATLLRVPTIQELGLVIRQGGMSAPWSSLVEIQPQGRKTPLFCMHGIGGDILIYWELAHRLGQEQPAYGLQMQGLYEGQQPHQTVAECAAHYIKEIQEVQPQGPYYLCGYSSGGIMAYEMAQQLIAQGETIGFLGMIDTNPSEERGMAEKLKDPKYTWGFIKNIPYWLQDLTRRSPQKLVGDVARKVKIVLKKVTDSLFPSKTDAEDVDLAEVMDGNVEGLSDQRQVAMQIHYQALVSYEPRLYPGRIDMFRSRRQPLFGYHDEKLGWGELLDGPMEVQHINGPHFQIMVPPYVEELADMFKKQLGDAQTRLE